MFARSFAILLALVLTPALAAQNQFGVEPLHLGDPAPDFGPDSVQWLKGEPVSAFQDGHIYVLDFWATWCTPCIQAMPVAAAIQEEYADANVHVLAIAIWPAPGMTPTAEFVRDNDELMDFTVGEATDDWVAGSYMLATGQTGIPTSMIIGREGELLFVGHPLSQEFHVVLQRVVDGSYTGADAKAIAAKQEQANRLIGEANALALKGDWDGAFAIMDEIIAIDPVAFAQLSVVKFQRLLLTLGRYDEAYAYAAELVDGPIKDNAYLLENIARPIVDAPGLAQRDLALARKAIDRCIELIGASDEGAMATYATVLFKQGETEKAVEAINSAMEIATAKNSQWLPEIMDRRDELLAASQAEEAPESPEASDG